MLILMVPGSGFLNHLNEPAFHYHCLVGLICSSALYEGNKFSNIAYILQLVFLLTPYLIHLPGEFIFPTPNDVIDGDMLFFLCLFFINVPALENEKVHARDATCEG